MMSGIGIDLLAIDRFAKLKNGSEFLGSVFTNRELEQISKCHPFYRIHAALFTIKEAILKALRCGLKRGTFWRDVNIDRDMRPSLKRSLLDLSKRQSIKKIHVSVACTRDYALGITLAETEE
jgi:holo-[acyl-carrier-protein] synthase